MKKYLFTILAMLLIAIPAHAQITVQQGGTGTSSIPTGYVPFGNINNLRIAADSAFTWDNTLKKLTVSYASTSALTVSGMASTSSFFANGLTGCAADSVITYNPSTGTFGCQQFFVVLTPPCTTIARSLQFNFSGGFGCATAVYATNGNIGINATATPRAALSIQAGGLSLYNTGDFFNGGTITSTSSNPSTLPFASTTMLTATTASTTNLWVSSIASGSLLKTTVGGQVIAATPGSDFANFAFPFTPATNYAVGVNATTGIPWFQNGLQASSTSQIAYASTSMISADTASTTSLFSKNATTTTLNVTRNLLLNNPAGTFNYNFITGAISANRRLTIPTLTSDDTLTVNGLAQSLQNKTFTGNFFINAGVVIKRGLFSSGSLTATDAIVGIDTTSAPTTVGLPIAPTNPQVYWIYDEVGNAGTNPITLVPNVAFGEVINGQTSYTIRKPYDGVFIYSVSAGSSISGVGEWHIIKSPSGSDIATSTASLRNMTATVSNVNAFTPTASSTYAVSVSTDVKAISAGTLTITCTYTNTNGVATTATFFPMGLTSAGLTGTGAAAFPTLNITPLKNNAVTVVSTFTGVSITYDIDASILTLGTGVN